VVAPSSDGVATFRMPRQPMSGIGSHGAAYLTN
jgi:hypothetical protein